ncbi:DUF6415 family natural product biosynthesis protein [Streptomyces rimosus]|uniref:DUF6415 family natural product biosynthesis protein n=1 Tax=Streptomyces rimosus TaxID=1927 RepID=UPI002D21852D|nr:hypothetical protein [Streptomyces rimosus]
MGAAEAPVAVQEIQAAITHILAPRRYVPGLPTARQHAKTRSTAAELLPLTEARAGSERARLVVVGLACARQPLRSQTADDRESGLGPNHRSIEQRGPTMKPGITAALYDPEGLLETALPLDREPYLSLVAAVLAWSGPEPRLQPRDYEQIALQLAGHAQAVAGDVRRHCAALGKDSEMLALTEVVLGEAERRLSGRPRATVTGIQHLARLVRALYERLDRLTAAAQSGSAPAPP